MKLRAFSVCVSAALAVSLMGLAGGTASADPGDPDCVAINTTIQGQLATLAEMAISSPTNFARAAPAVLASIQALRTLRPDCGGPSVPTIDQLLPKQQPQPQPQRRPSNQCEFKDKQAEDICNGISNAGLAALDTIMPGGVLYENIGVPMSQTIHDIIALIYPPYPGY